MIGVVSHAKSRGTQNPDSVELHLHVIECWFHKFLSKFER